MATKMRLDDFLASEGAENNAPKRMRLGDFLALEEAPVKEVFTQFTPEETEKYQKMGKIGAVETAIRKDYLDIIPFVGGAKQGVEMVSLLNAVNRLQADDYKRLPDYKEKDIKRVNDYLRAKEEERIRGRTIPGQITQGVMELPGFMIEFLATGGASAIGREGTEKIAFEAMKKVSHKGIKKTVAGIAGRMTSATIRTGLMPHRVVKSFADRQVNNSLELTEKGWKIVSEGREKPTVSAMKAFGDVWVENFSEEIGSALTAGAKKIGAKLPPRLTKGIIGLYKRLHPNESITKLATKLGWNGFVEEVGEERFGAFMRAVFGIEDFGAENPERMMDRIISSIPNGEELLVEAGILIFPGAANVATQQMVSLVRERKAQMPKEELPVQIKELVPEEILDKIAAIGEEKPAEVKEEAKPVEIKPEEAVKKEIKKITTVESLQKKLESLESTEAERKFLRQMIREGKKEGIPERTIEAAKKNLEELKPGVVKRKDVNILKDKIKNIERGIKEGKKLSGEEIKAVQSELVNALKESPVIPKHFLSKIKNVQTQEQLKKIMPEISKDITKIENKIKIKEAKEKIKRELKYTKPKKAGAVKVGKYDYETNKTFVEIREYAKLTQEKAAKLLADFGEATDELGAIKQRFLSLQANGAKASAQMHEQVLDDILRLKKAGEQAKTEADFKKAVNRENEVTAIVDSISKMKGTAKSIRTKAVNLYRQGFSNIYSMLNSLIGKQLADKYNPELQENARDSAIYFKMKETVLRSAELFGIKTNEFVDKLTKMENEKFDLVDFEGLKIEISKLGVLDIYNSIKNEAVRKRYYDAFGQEQIDKLMSPLTLTDQEKEFADYLQDVVQEYYEVHNARSIALRNLDLGRVENYWPATSEYLMDIIDDIRIQGETPSAQKQRARGKVIPVPKSAWFKFQKHIAQGEHARHLSPRYIELKKLFSNRKIKNHITNKFGEKVYNTLLDQIDNISLNSQTGRIDAISGVLGKLLNNWVTAKVAISPSVFVKQLLSVGNYMEDMNSVEWTKYFMEGINSPKKTFDFMWNNAKFLEARFNRGYAEAISRALSEAENVGKLKNNWAKAMTALARMGDIGAIIYGGYPVIKGHLAEHPGDMEGAVRKFELSTLRSQQSGLASSRSQFQNSKNPMARLFLAFKNTANQYLRKQVDAIISYSNKDISKKQFVKTMMIYSIIQPALYGTASVVLGKFLYKGFDEEDDLAIEIFNYLAAAPVNAIPLIDDLVKAALRKVTGQRIYKVFDTPLFDDLESGARKLLKDEITIYDVLESIGTFAEPITGAPIKTYTKIGKRIFGDMEEKGR